MLEAVHEQFDTTLKVVVPAVYATFWFDGVTLRVHGAAAWVTVTTIGVRPETVTVILAVRCVVFGFCVNVAVMVPLPEPDDGEIVHQV